MDVEWVTINVDHDTRHKLKQVAAQMGVPMYRLVDHLINNFIPSEEDIEACKG